MGAVVRGGGRRCDSFTSEGRDDSPPPFWRRPSKDSQIRQDDCLFTPNRIKWALHLKSEEFCKFMAAFGARDPVNDILP